MTSGLRLSSAASPLFYCVLCREFKGINSIFQPSPVSGMAFFPSSFIRAKKSSIDALHTCQGAGSASGFVEVLSGSVPRCPAVLGWRLEGDGSEQTQESCEMKNDVPRGSPAPTPTKSQGISYDRASSILLCTSAMAEGTLRAMLLVGTSPGQ